MFSLKNAIEVMFGKRRQNLLSNHGVADNALLCDLSQDSTGRYIEQSERPNSSEAYPAESARPMEVGGKEEYSQLEKLKIMREARRRR
jgi:hypothetical protein